ncbi:MAG: response regulator transcription factor [Saprospiraceae bacterium]|nr:response regulator transcription factor [Saprospiraceae bacterium]
MNLSTIYIYTASRDSERFRDLWHHHMPYPSIRFENAARATRFKRGSILVKDIGSVEDLNFIRRSLRQNISILTILSDETWIRAVIKEDVAALLYPNFTEEEALIAMRKSLKCCFNRNPDLPKHIRNEVIRNHEHIIDRSEHPNRLKKNIPAPMNHNLWPFPENLTPREIQLMRALSRGLLNKEIATHLGITEGTVKQHLHNIYDKLEVTNKVEAINLFNRHNSIGI